MDKLRITFTNGSLSSDLNDIVEKCNELLIEVKEKYENINLEELNLQFYNGQQLCAPLLNSIVSFLNTLANVITENKFLDLTFENGEMLCKEHLDKIVKFINDLINDINDESNDIINDIYELIVINKSSLKVPYEESSCKFQATIYKNGLPYSDEILVTTELQTTLTRHGVYLDVEVIVPNSIENKTYDVVFSSEEIQQSITRIIYQSGEEIEEPEEDVYKVEFLEKRLSLEAGDTSFTLKVIATKNGINQRSGVEIQDVNYEINGLPVTPKKLLFDFISYEYIDGVHLYHYVAHNNEQVLASRKFKVFYQGLEDTAVVIQQGIVTNNSLPVISVDAISYHTELEADETEMEVISEVLLDGEYQEDVIFNIIDLQGEILWQRHLSNGSNIASLQIPRNTSTDSRQFSVVAEYTYDGTTYVSSPVIFTQQGISTTSESEHYYIIQWNCNLENATINNKNSDVIQIEEGENWSGTIYCPEGYSIENITDNGNEINISNYINITDIQENHNFIVTLSQTEFIETLTVIPSSLNIKVGDTINFVINSNSYQQAYNYAKLKFSESEEPFYNLHVEGNKMNILQTDEGVDIADSRNIKTAGYFIAPYEKLNAYTSVPNQINYSLKAIGEGEIKLSFVSYYGQNNYIGAITQCTINVSEADPNYRLVLHPSVIELNINGDPGQVRATLIGHKLGQPNWTLIQDNYETSIELEDFNCIVYPADVVGTREKEFIAIKNGEEYKATLIVVTRDWELTEVTD